MNTDPSAWQGIDPQRYSHSPPWQERSFYIQDSAAFIIQKFFKKITAVNKEIKIKTASANKINVWAKNCLKMIKEKQKAEKKREKNRRNRAAKKERRRQTSPTSTLNAPLNLPFEDRLTIFIQKVNEFIETQMEEFASAMEHPLFTLNASYQGLAPTYIRGVEQVKKDFLKKLSEHVALRKKELFSQEDQSEVKENFTFYNYYFESSFSEFVKKARANHIKHSSIHQEFSKVIQWPRCTHEVRTSLKNIYNQFIEEYKGSEINQPRFLNYFGMQMAFKTFLEAYKEVIKNKEAFFTFSKDLRDIETGALKEFEILPIVSKKLFENYAQFLIEKMERDVCTKYFPLEEKIMFMRGELQAAGVVHLPILLKKIISEKALENIEFIETSRHQSNQIRLGLKEAIREKRKQLLSTRSVSDEMKLFFERNPSFLKNEKEIKLLYTQLRNEYLGVNAEGEKRPLLHQNYGEIFRILTEKVRAREINLCDDLD